MPAPVQAVALAAWVAWTSKSGVQHLVYGAGRGEILGPLLLGSAKTPKPLGEFPHALGFQIGECQT